MVASWIQRLNRYHLWCKLSVIKPRFNELINSKCLDCIYKEIIFWLDIIQFAKVTEEYSEIVEILFRTGGNNSQSEILLFGLWKKIPKVWKFCCSQKEIIFRWDGNNILKVLHWEDRKKIPKLVNGNFYFINYGIFLTGLTLQCRHG